MRKKCLGEKRKILKHKGHEVHEGYWAADFVAGSRPSVGRDFTSFMVSRLTWITWAMRRRTARW